MERRVGLRGWQVRPLSVQRSTRFAHTSRFSRLRFVESSGTPGSIHADDPYVRNAVGRTDTVLELPTTSIRPATATTALAVSRSGTCDRFGRELRWQCDPSRKSLRRQFWNFLRRQFGRQHLRRQFWNFQRRQFGRQHVEPNVELGRRGSGFGRRDVVGDSSPGATVSLTTKKSSSLSHSVPLGGREKLEPTAIRFAASVRCKMYGSARVGPSLPRGPW